MGFLRALAILTRVSKDGNNARVSYLEIFFAWHLFSGQVEFELNQPLRGPILSFYITFLYPLISFSAHFSNKIKAMIEANISDTNKCDGQGKF